MTRTRRTNVRAALALAVALTAGTLGTADGQPPAEQATTGAECPRCREYLKRGLEQLQRLEARIPALGIERDAAAALSASALAAAGEEESVLAQRYVSRVLDSCRKAWHRVSCERAQLALQRVLLQYPSVLGAELGERLRLESSNRAPAPSPAQIAAPWDFRETENQRIVKAARSLVGAAIAGSTAVGDARQWAHYVESFLDAHRDQGWYEGDSPGYLAISMAALLLLADHAPDAATGTDVRRRAREQLDILFASWAQLQVGGYPAGAKSRAYLHWVLGIRNVPWPGWAWLLGGMGRIDRLSVGDFPELAASSYHPPSGVVRLLVERRAQPPYEVVQRRHIDLPHRASLQAVLYSQATPDFILSTAQALGGSRLGVSGGEEIMVTLYAEGEEFAPLYLWSRSTPPGKQRWSSAAGRDLAVGEDGLVVARLGNGASALGYAYFGPPWQRPEILGSTVVSSYGETLVALVTIGDWEVAAAPQRFPEIFGGDKNYRGSWVAVPARQPAAVALRVARRSAVADVARWRESLSAARLELDDDTLRYAEAGRPDMVYEVGRTARLGNETLTLPAESVVSASPFLSGSGGRWTFRLDGMEKVLVPPPE